MPDPPPERRPAQYRTVAPATHAALQRDLLEWYACEQRDLPWRRTGDPYAILVSEIMLQQTQVERVIPKYHEFLARFPGFEALAGAGRAEVIRAWSPLGYNRRAVRLHELSRRVVQQHGGQLPRHISELAVFEGLGAYTAAAVACFAFGAQVPTLDTNVRRVLSRLLADRFAAGGPTPRELRQAAEALLPHGRGSDWNQALMDLGATICKTTPACERCPVSRHCASHGADGVATRGRLRAAEARVTYSAANGYAGSSRYFRGRIVERLRQLPPDSSIGLDGLGAALRPEFSPTDRPWLLGLLRGLASDGLVCLEGDPDLGGDGAISVRLG